MEMFTTLVLAFSGSYFIIAALFLNTQNATSTLLFKFIPFMLGLCLLVLFATDMGLVILS